MNSSKSNVSVDFDAYQEWRKRYLSSSQPVNDSCNRASGYALPTTRRNDGNFDQNGSGNEPGMPSASAEPVAAEARYPTSFSHIVELITTGQPVPGIKDVPGTLLSGQDSRAVKSKRKKPWEDDINRIPMENDKPS